MPASTIGSPPSPRLSPRVTKHKSPTMLPEIAALHRKSSSDQIREMEEQDSPVPQIKPNKDHFPISIVWCPLPLLTWLFPFIGHLGVCKSDGIIHDFAASEYINRHKQKMGFGSVTKFAPVNLHLIKGYTDMNSAVRSWDDAVDNASKKYDNLSHNLILNNCHAHVATVLNSLEYRGITYWNTVLLILYMCWQGKFVSSSRFFLTYAGFFVVVIFACVILGLGIGNQYR